MFRYQWEIEADIVKQPLRQEVRAWLATRPDASSLDIVAAYDELRHLDTKERLLEHSSLLNTAVLKLQSGERYVMKLIQPEFEPRRQLLRSRALELSRSGLRPLKITELPLDVLHIIFNDFQDATITQGLDWRSVWPTPRIWERRFRRQIVANFRLVCRLFYRLATPLLFPVLRIQLTQASLDFVEKISTAPDIAAGVRGIEISFGYRPKEYADSIERFKTVRFGALSKFEAQCREDLQDSDVFTGSEGLGREAYLEEALDNYADICHEWEKYVRATGRGETHVGALSEYQDIFQKGYAEYCRLQKEQQDLLQDGSFATSLAAAAARMPNLHCFNFVDGCDLDDLTDDFAYDHVYDHVDFLNKNGSLSWLMSVPVSIRDIQKESLKPEDKVCNLECLRLLWELPITLHRTGVSVTHIRISKLPGFTNLPMVYPQDHTRAPTWDELASACETLEFLTLDIEDCWEIRKAPLTDKEKFCLNNFLDVVSVWAAFVRIGTQYGYVC